MINARRFIAKLSVALVLASVLVPACAFADEALGDVDTPNKPAATSAGGADATLSDTTDSSAANAASSNDSAGDSAASNVAVSREGSAALVDGSNFAISDFSRAQKGSNREIDGTYYGYSYLIGSESNAFVQIVAAGDYVVCYVPTSALASVDVELTTKTKDDIKAYFCALDELQAAGSKALSDYETWYFTTEKSYDVEGACFNFDQQISDGIYISVIGTDGSDLTDSDNPNYLKPTFADFGKLVLPDTVTIVEKPTGFAAMVEFLSNLDWSPLWVSLRTTGIAIVIIFILGLLAAYLCLNVSQKVKNILDVIFTIPMVLPPTVCGFVLLFACGSNTAFGQFFIDIGFPLIFSPVACIIAAVVVAFPLMYRNALGAFEGLDRNMLDAARTLGWSNMKIFRKLMLPLSWSSIAAGTVLAFARALGEFGATLFMAGNYVGITRTIPIAIYFEWMNGNSDTAWFWTAVIIVFSFFVILFINLWTSHNTKYRKRDTD